MIFIGQDRMMDRYTFSIFLVKADTFEKAKEIYKSLLKKNLSQFDVKVTEKDDYIGYSYFDEYEIDGWMKNEQPNIYKNEI